MKTGWLLLVGFFSATCLQAQTRMSLLDVGEGQSLLLSAEGRGVLIDTGHAGQASRVLDRLSANGVAELEFVILTHLHPDHASGLFRIREAFPDVPVYTSCQPLPADVRPDMTRWVHEYLRHDPAHHCLKAGSRLQFNDTSIHVLWPYGFRSHDLNAHSLVLHLSRPGRSILLMADAGIGVEQQLLAKQVLPRRVDVLVVGHHGADDASSEAFLEYVAPRRAVISINRDNLRGYPSPRVLERLKSLGIPTRITYLSQHIDL